MPTSTFDQRSPMAAARRSFFGQRAGAAAPGAQYSPPPPSGDVLGYHRFAAPGLYGQQPTYGATNEMAHQFFQMHGQMPNRTMGGNFGAALPNPDNRQVGPQLFDQMRGNSYAPMGSAPLQNAPTGLQGYAQQMLAQNPHGTFFGGALPAYGSTPGGRRPMFMGPPALPGPQMTPDQMAGFAKQTNTYYNPATGALDGTNLGLNPRKQALAGIVGRVGPGASAETLAQNRATTDFFRNSVPNNAEALQDPLGMMAMAQNGNRFARRFLAGQRAQQRQQGRDMQAGRVDPLTAFFFQNPEMAMAHQYQQQQLGLAQQHENNLHSRGMFTAQNNAAANQAKLSGADNQLMGQYIAALPQLVQGGHVTADDAQRAVEEFQRRMFGGASGASGASGSPVAATVPEPAKGVMSPDQWRRFASLPAKDRDAHLISNFGITDNKKRQSLLQAAAGRTDATAKRPQGNSALWNLFMGIDPNLSPAEQRQRAADKPLPPAEFGWPMM
jgi:hypothetical protein